MTMGELARWAVAAILAAIWLLIAGGNIATVISTATGKRPVSLALFIGGISGAAGMLVCPLPNAARWAWVPAVLDIGCVPTILFMCYSALAGMLTGKKEGGMPHSDERPAPAPRPMTIETSSFGPVTLPGNGASFMDGGTHGCIGHTLTVDNDRTATWEQRLDSMGDPSDCSGSGRRTLGDEDWSAYLRLSAALWDLAEKPPEGERYFDVPRYQWALVVRRGDEVRVFQGPPSGYPWAEPATEAKAVLDWMAERVAAWCAEDARARK